MKNTFLQILLIAVVGPSLLLARSRPEKNSTDQEEFNIIPLSEFSKGIESGMPLERLRNIILQCDEGTELPIKMTIQGDILSLNPNLLTLKLLKTCYIKSGKGALLFSTDMKEWKEFSDFFIGKAATSLNFQNQFAQVNLELEMYHKKNRWEIPIGTRWSDLQCKNVYIHSWSHCPPESIYGEYAGQPPYYIETRTETRTKW